MFSIGPQTNDLDNLDSLTGDVMEAFQVVNDTLTQPDTQTVVAHGGHYTNALVNAMLKAAHKNVVALQINFLPPNLQTKVM